MTALRNPRREAFARARAEGKGLAEAYAEAGYPAHAGNAHRLSKNEEVAARILEIQNQTAQRTVTTIEDMIAQIDDDRRFARERGHSAVALAASATKAKLMGFFAERPPQQYDFNYAQMTEEEVLFEIAAIHQELRAIKVSKGVTVIEGHVRQYENKG